MRSELGGWVANWLRATHRPRYSDERGLSLVEATIILMVMATLTAIIAPSVRGSIREAQEATAKEDTAAISGALARMLTDVGEAWFVRNGARTGTATNQGAPSHGANTRVDLMVSAGATPTLTATARVSGTDWDDTIDNAAIQTMENYLVLNTPGGSSANAYRTGASNTGTGNFDPDSGAGFNAPYAWRGAYLTGPIGSDPWGNRYMANVEFLARTQGTTGSGSAKDVIVLSAGANKRTDTVFEIDGTTMGVDDIGALVSGGTR
jgi:type II secretory pathway pseudopilin PulG